MDKIPLPPRTRGHLRGEWGAGEIPADSEPIDLALTDEEVEILDTPGLTDSAIGEESLLRDTPSQSQSSHLVNLPEDTWDVGLLNESMGPGHQWHETSYVCHGAVTCEDYAVAARESCLDHTFSTFYQMDSLVAQENASHENAKRLNAAWGILTRTNSSRNRTRKRMSTRTFF